ncbi:hypothetical protein BJ999_006832 [Actinomadura citrea]|uniref:Uncharacterized protein n=1 Tax=Actinomadura citrea TaxID=46158 RepID=A0A7Y9KGJ6_9ACTN|nr:hypothetical protein [Actinomadura citrea]
MTRHGLIFRPSGRRARQLTGNTLFADGGSHVNGVAWTPDLDGEQ